MRKTAIFFMTVAAVSMFFAGCKKDSKVVTFGVEVEKAAADSKLYIDEDHNPVFFQSGEQVNVNGTDYNVIYSAPRYEVEVQEEGEGAVYYAAYPTSLFNGLSVDGFNGTSNQPVHLSRWQPYVLTEDGKQNVQLPAGAIINDGTKKFKFYNFCSLLEVQWTNTSTYDYDIIGIEVTVPGVGLYGNGTATLDGTSSSIVLADNLKNRVNLDIQQNDRETVAPNGTSRKYYVILPPFENKNVTVRIQTMRHSQNSLDDQKLRAVTVSTNNAVTLPRNYIVPMHVTSTPEEQTGLTGYFSIDGDLQGNDTYKVVFSRGNLQHIQNGLGRQNPSHNLGEWKFADRQYDFFGRYNVTTDAYYMTGTVDLFAWSNSEFNLFGLATYDTWNGEWGTGSFKDWGEYKVISGDPANTWFTLRADEWFYLFKLRVHNTGDDLRGKAKITGIQGHQAVAAYGNTPVTEVSGFILMPDDWTPDDVPAGLSFTPASVDSTYENVYSVSDWARMEAAGAMFLPAAGWGSSYHNQSNDHSDGSDIFETYQSGQYWSATKKSGGYAESGYVSFQYNNYRWFLTNTADSYGNAGYFAGYDTQWWRLRSVRLVKPAPGYGHQSTRPARAYEGNYTGN